MGHQAARTSVNLTWRDNANNELGYRIESKIGATGTYELLTTLGPNTTAATINNLIEGTQYYYRLQGVNAGGRSAYSNETSVDDRSDFSRKFNRTGVILVPSAFELDR